MPSKEALSLQDLRKSTIFAQERMKLAFATELYDQMVRAGDRQKDLARAAGKSEAYISKVLRGDTNLTIESMVSLACAVHGQVHLKITHEDDGMIWAGHVANRQAGESGRPVAPVPNWRELKDQLRHTYAPTRATSGTAIAYAT